VLVGYPIRLERWLMEGSYDRVWKTMKSREVPCEEYSVFSEVSSRPSSSPLHPSDTPSYFPVGLSSHPKARKLPISPDRYS